MTGLAGSEDAGVYKISDDLALVQTIDFFTPIVDDPAVFGRAAAANSLSDVYAMGGKPITALNIVCFPSKKLGLSTLRRILAGGLEILDEAGVALIGGHSVEDDEPKYGLSVTGLIRPDQLMTNSGLKPGDVLILTKALGTGVIATAGKASAASEGALKAMVDSMCSINKAASEAGVSIGAKAATDVTGFGVAGHLVEMARASKALVKIDSAQIPLLEGAIEAAKNGFIPGGAYANRKFFSSWISLDDGIPMSITDLLFDPQTSGGLIIGAPEAVAGELLKKLENAGVSPLAKIGFVESGHPDGLVEIS